MLIMLDELSVFLLNVCCVVSKKNIFVHIFPDFPFPKSYINSKQAKHTHIYIYTYIYVFAIFFSWLDFLVVKASFDVVPG